MVVGDRAEVRPDGTGLLHVHSPAFGAEVLPLQWRPVPGERGAPGSWTALAPLVRDVAE